MKLHATITVSWTDKKGKVHKRTRVARSFVRSFIDLLYVKLTDLKIASGLLDIANAVQTSYTTQQPADMSCGGGTGNVSLGIIVGTSTQAVVVGDHDLITPIAHGTGSGQLSYGSTTFTDPVTSGGDRKFTISRTFTNGSGADITVNEVGLYAQHRTVAANPSYFCMDRTLNTFTVTNGTSKTVTYTIKVTV